MIRGVTSLDRGQYTCTVTSACGVSTSGPCVLAACRADFNDDGTVGVQDIFDFLYYWFQGDPLADFTQNGIVSLDDLFAFLAAWFAGCN